MPTVSVIIPTYNYGLYIAEAIESVLAQTYPADEIIVVDDGSTDDTEKVVAAYGDEVFYIKQQNSGVSAARNNGIEQSTGDFLAFLDADDTWHPTKLEKQILKFESDPAIGLVHCGTRLFDSETGDTIQLFTEGAEEDVVNDLLLWEKPGIPGPGGAILVSRSVMDDAGGFDTAMKCGEDLDFCFRIAQNFKVAFVPDPLLNYRIHTGGEHRNLKNMEAGMSVFYEKCFSNADASMLKLRRRAYGNFHRVLAGSYLYERDFMNAARHVGSAFYYRPFFLVNLMWKRFAQKEAQ